MVNHKSTAAFSHACRVLPGGVNSPVRAFGGVDIEPLFIESAQGSRIRDIDGNEFIDYVGSWGPMILGHAHPAVLDAIHRAVDKGTSFGAPTEAETELAERIIGAFESIQKVRLVSSGTEAVMTAIRLARAFTGRDLIVKMAGCYHGHSDSLLVAAGSGVAEAERRRSAGANPGLPSSPGVPSALAALTIVVPYNDLDAVGAAFEAHRDRIAGVLVEPVAANMGVVPPAEGYLESLRLICDLQRAVLIFDEVISGFRVAFGGAQERYGVQADLTCLGKIIGGGLPLAAFGGKAEIMDMLAPNGKVYQAGTLSGNPIATAAANATLELLTQRDTYDRLEATGAALGTGLTQAAAEADVRVTLNRVGSILSCFFTDRPVRNFADVQTTDIARFKRFFTAMLERGIYLAPSAYEAMFVSLAHTEQDVERTIQAARESFKACS
ncbi:MAG: glutamate-1-semialdehyde 2,1-aminomutase [Sedimentisphaerales bacterium]|nr:glutamate-1-semialdehyde 2,1-aminomutase [Sedimentisphaerales bacterium]